MPLTSEEIEVLRCPRCCGALRPEGAGLTCGQCSEVYALRDRGAELLPWSSGEPGPEWTRWKTKLGLLRDWRRSTWDGSAASGNRQRVADDLAQEFFRFLDVPERAAVLDIGCGGGALASYLPSRRYWGLDPAPQAPAVPDPFHMIILSGVGESLPLVDAFFDVVLLCQTLDHCRDPATVMLEARRVLKPGGILGIMQSLAGAAPSTPPPLKVRVRSRLGRIKSRLLGRRRIDAAETKTVPLDRAATVSLVRPVLEVDASREHGQVLFLKATRTSDAREAVPT